MKTNNILDLLTDILVRLGSKSPKLFVWIQNISIAIAIITGIPALAEQLQIPLPEWMFKVGNASVAIYSALSYIISKLPVDETKLKQDLPFTGTQVPDPTEDWPKS